MYQANGAAVDNDQTECHQKGERFGAMVNS